MFENFTVSLWSGRERAAKDEHFSVRPLMEQWQECEADLGVPGPCAIDPERGPAPERAPAAHHPQDASQASPSQPDVLRDELKELLASIERLQSQESAPDASSAEPPEASRSLRGDLARLDHHQSSSEIEEGTPPARHGTANEEVDSTLLDRLPESLRGTYAQSVGRLEDRVYDLAGALTSLDGIDIQLSSAREHLGVLRAQGMPIDYHKVRNVLEEMATAVGSIINEFDSDECNLLGDARIQIAITEHGKASASGKSIELNLISVDKLMALSSKLEPTPHDIDRFVELLSRALDGNIQILSGIMLTLFAARDYTNSVTELAVETGIVENTPVPAAERTQRTLENAGEVELRTRRTSGETSLAQLSDRY